MRLSAKISCSAWVIAGLVGGLVLAPAAAVAATVMVLRGANGPAVNATNANQLLTAEAPPSAWVSVYGWNDTAGSCSNLPAPNAAGGFIVRQVDVDVTGSGTGGQVYLFDGAGCAPGGIIGEVNGASGTVTLPFTPGIAIPKKGVISVSFIGAVTQAQIDVLGYRVPASDAVAGTTVLRCAFTPSACGE